MAHAAVSALLIVRNEAHNLADCFASLRSKVDEIVVVDTGSDDDSVRIARDLGARVSHFPWIGDFAAARNASIQACNTPWGLYIDADERLTRNLRQPIGNLLAGDWLAAEVLLKPKRNYTRCRLPRLFRIDPRIRFQGAIHETIVPSLERLTERGAAIGSTQIEIDHFGYEGDLGVKHLRNLPLLKRCVEEWPDRVYYRLHLAETLLGLDRPAEAIAVGRAGIMLAENSSFERSRIDGAVLCQLLAAHQLQHGNDPLALIETGLRLHASNCGLLLTLGQRNLRHGDAESSLGIAQQLQAIDPDALTPGPIAYDRDIFGRLAIELEVASLLLLGRTGEAAAVLIRKTAPPAR